MSIGTRFIRCCPVGCDGELCETTVSLPEGCLLSCSTCGQLVSQIDESRYETALTQFNSWQGTLPPHSAQRRHDQRAARIFHRIRLMLGLDEDASLRLLDVGCSTGALIMSALRNGIEAEGVEPAEVAAQSAQAAGLRVRSSTLSDAAYPTEHFHAVTLMEVIEHLRDPGDLVREIRRILVPGGLLVVGTGNAASWTVKLMGGRWDYFQVERYGGHISFFTPRSLGCLADRCGFHLEYLETKRVRFAESHQASPVIYRALKVLAEVCSIPASFMGKGHDMLAFLRKV
jgi:2-polyprenyl-3-methyl-5-hydroxy-6-metoxy-1,4-benzoquinol methylase